MRKFGLPYRAPEAKYRAPGLRASKTLLPYRAPGLRVRDTEVRARVPEAKYCDTEVWNCAPEAKFCNSEVQILNYERQKRENKCGT